MKRIPSIDGLRAISILFVIVGHLAPTIKAHHTFGAFGNLMWKLSAAVFWASPSFSSSAAT